MRFLLGIVAAAALAWGLYWFVGARALERGLAAAREEAAGNGVVAEYEAGVRGFPNRFDVTLENVTLTDPQSGDGWSAPFFQIFALSYRPHHVIAVWPETQRLVLGGAGIAISSADMRGSLRLRPETALPIDRAVFVTEAPRLRGDDGWTLSAEDARLALRAVDGAPAALDLGIEIAGLRPDPGVLTPLLARMPDGTALPPLIALLRLDARLDLDRPLDRFAFGDGRGPVLDAIALREARMVWGDLDLAASGTLTLEASGHLAGRIETATTNWQALPSLAVAAGLIREEVAPTFHAALEVLAGLSDPPGVLHVPLVMSSGRMSFGPVPLGPAPRLR